MSSRAAILWALWALCALAWAGVSAAQAPTDILGTKHNLSVSGPGPVKASEETRVCIFCHTPHNATPQSPLWNRAIEPQTYVVYASPTLQAGPLPPPSGPTKLCLTCHDGTIALGTVVNPAGGIAMDSGTLPPGSFSNFGLDLSGHHPVAFSYEAALPNPELVSPPPSELAYGAVDEVHCISCHDPHDDRFGRFLVKDNRYSALCTTCHQVAGWPTSVHAMSVADVSAYLPTAYMPANPPWTWTTLGEWGCQACHTPHFAPTPEHLLNFTTDPTEPFECTTCHGGGPPGPPHMAAGSSPPLTGADIAAQVRKPSAHPQPPPELRHRSGAVGDPRDPGLRNSGCADCHNAHRISDDTAAAPYVSGRLAGVAGVDRNGVGVDAATYEYEICFRCHGDDSPGVERVPRVVASTNTRREFDDGNPSYHPVVAMARNVATPSIPSALAPDLDPAGLLYCTTCHADDEGGSRGPHGSSFAPILKERYETADGTPESYDNYALCYRCHERESILADRSFRNRAFRTTPSGGGHSGHLAAGAPCAVCHDPHGIDAQEGDGTGSHTHLVNFDIQVVLPLPGAPYPIFNDTGSFSGSCSLSCHGVVHNNTAYP